MLWLFLVTSTVELVEHVEKERILREADPEQAGRHLIGTFEREERTEQATGDELYELKLGDVALPPEIITKLGAERC